MPNYLIPAASWPGTVVGTSSSSGWGGVDFYTGSSGVSVHALGWFRAATTGTGAVQLKLRDTVDNSDLVTVTAPDDGLIGWHYVNISPAIPLTTGRIYRVAFLFSSGLAVSQCPVVTPDAPFVYETSRYGSVWPTIEGTISNEQQVSVADAPITGPVTPGDTTTIITTPGAGAGESFPPWFSADPAIQTHETDGLPWLTKVVADATKNAVDATKIVVDATKDIVDLIPKKDDADWTAIKKLWQIAGVLTDAEIDLWNLFAKRAPGQLTGPTPGGGSAFYGPSGGQVAERAEVAATNGELVWHRLQTAHQLDAVPGGDWLLADSLDWSGPIGWNQEADAYICHIDSYPATWDHADVAGHLWLPRAAWWSPLNGTLPEERRFVDFEHQTLHRLPVRCSGILLAPRSGFTGTLEAWIRPTPPIP